MFYYFDTKSLNLSKLFAYWKCDEASLKYEFLLSE